MAREEWARLQSWARREGIPLRGDIAPPDWLIALYLSLRLTDPTSSSEGTTVKWNTAQTISENLKRHAKNQQWEYSHLQGKATKITSLMAAAKKLLPESQVTEVRARPITAPVTEGSTSELDMLLDHLEGLAAQPAISAWWLYGWRAQLLTGIQGPMRGGETVTAAISNLAQAETPEGNLAFRLTIPVSKARKDPKDLVFFCICNDDRDRTCPAHALVDWLQILADHGYQGDALFPVTPRYDPRLPPPQPTGPVLPGDTAGLQRLTAEIVDQDDPGNDLSKMTDEEFDFACPICRTTATESLRDRAGRKYSCRMCGRRAVNLARGHRYESTPNGQISFVDAVAVRLANPSFGTGRIQAERHVNAVTNALGRQRRQLKEFCRDTGIHPRNEFESITFHGLKRGGVTTLALKNVSDVKLQAFAHHKSMDTTNLYIDHHRPSPHATSSLDPWKGPVGPSALDDLDRVIRPNDSDQAT